MADQKKKQFTKVNQLRPLDTGLNLTVKVVNAKTIAPRGRAQGRLAECLVGDDTGIIIFTARNDQVDLVKDGNTLVLSNAKIDMFKGSMKLAVDRFGRLEVMDLVKDGNTLVLSNAKIDMFKGSMKLAVDRFGRLEVSESASFSVKGDVNMSLIEFERIDMVV